MLAKATRPAAAVSRRDPLWRRGCLSSAVALSVAALLTACSGSPTSPSSASNATAAPYSNWVMVTAGPLTTSQPLDGVVQPLRQSSISIQGAGVLTSMAPLGTIVTPGSVLLSINEAPVIALPGEIPMYRDLTPSVDAPVSGGDVKQLQFYLTSAGYYSGADNGVLNTPTINAAKEMRKDLGLVARDGFLATEVAFIPGAQPWIVAKTLVQIGSSISGGEVLEIASDGVGLLATAKAEPPPGSTYAIAPTPGSTAATVPLTTDAPPLLSPNGDGYSVTLRLSDPAGQANFVVGQNVVVIATQVVLADTLLIPVAAVRVDLTGETYAICREHSSEQAGRNCSISVAGANDEYVGVGKGLTATEEVALSP